MNKQRYKRIELTSIKAFNEAEKLLSKGWIVSNRGFYSIELRLPYTKEIK